jgi:hypothetical protein
MNLSCREVRKRKNGIDKKPLIKGKSTEKNWFPEADINRYFSRSQRQRNAAVVKSYRLILSALNFSLEFHQEPFLVVYVLDILAHYRRKPMADVKL